MTRRLTGSGRRVYRGGSWLDVARFCRSAFRHWSSPGYRSYILGLRLAIPLKDVKHNG